MSKSNHIIVRYKNLEILCHPETVIKYRQKKLPLSKVLITEDNIYKNVKKGDIASDSDIKKALQKDDITLTQAFEILLEKGDFQMTTKERQELTLQRRLRLVEYFHENFLDPKTNGPHPKTRIDAAFEQIKAKINFEMSFDKNAEEIRKAILGILPIKPNDSNNAIINTPINTPVYTNKNKNKNKEAHKQINKNNQDESDDKTYDETYGDSNNVKMSVNVNSVVNKNKQK